MKKAVFLDRDGIIIQPVLGEAPTEVSTLKLIPQIVPVIKKIKSLGFLIFVVSNQPDIALGLIDETAKRNLELKFKKLLNENGLIIDKIYYCHHAPHGLNPKYSFDCECKKPKPGMILRASKEFDIDLKNSFMVGDRASDVKAGKAAGVKTILFDPSGSQLTHLKKLKVKPDYSTSNFNQINEILSQNKIAFVLAAGSGTRMLPLTKNIPKPLIKIDKKPMLRFILDLLEYHGFKRVGINVFQFGEQIEKYLKKSSIKVIKEKSLTGTGGGVLAISKELIPNTSFLIIASDMLVNFDLSRIYKFHLRHGGIATICCYFRPKSKIFAKKSGLVLFDRKTKEIIRIIERPDKIISQWINSSVYIFKPEVLKTLRKFTKNQIDIPKDLLPVLLKSGNKVFAYPVNSKKFYQLGIDTPERVKAAEADIKSGKFIPTIP